MGISFTNAEIVELNDFGRMRILAMLAGKPLPPKIAWTVSDIIEYVRERAKKYGATQKALADRHAIAEGATLESLAPEIRAEFDELNEITEEMPVEPITLPIKDATGREIWYEPIIFSALRKIIKREEAGK
jgi:hypothetical protein